MIDNDQKLDAFLPRLRAAAWIALDTEADSLHSYPEKLCLLQISLPGEEALVDPLAGLNLGAFFEALTGHELILHGADYDLRLLWRTYRFAPTSVFDTMLAARILGYNEFGLTHLVGRLLGVHLEKGPQKADWARRPLTERMENYARNDTRYLKPIANLLGAELAAKGRREWHREMCERLIEQCATTAPADSDQDWRVKGADKLDRRGLAVLRELWQWREAEALASGKPPYFILSHETLVGLAGRAAQSRNPDLQLPPRFPPQRRDSLAAAIERGRLLPASQWPDRHRPSGRRLTEPEKRRYEELRRRRDAQASQLGIDATLIASKAILVGLATNRAGAETGLMNWQRELLGRQARGTECLRE